ncbi:collagen alpha-1(I) chain-like [Passer montanus]|uniref:collagen alpha-1(I) chain-like n=1 Tax=Passer montanus TaxID=9160 RepID=UPI0019620374|nr:collagen alpha-1(I) chain-like [Passer montanus]
MWGHEDAGIWGHRDPVTQGHGAGQVAAPSISAPERRIRAGRSTTVPGRRGRRFPRQTAAGDPPTARRNGGIPGEPPTTRPGTERGGSRGATHGTAWYRMWGPRGATHGTARNVGVPGEPPRALPGMERGVPGDPLTARPEGCPGSPQGPHAVSHSRPPGAERCRCWNGLGSAPRRCPPRDGAPQVGSAEEEPLRCREAQGWCRSRGGAVGARPRWGARGDPRGQDRGVLVSPPTRRGAGRAEPQRGPLAHLLTHGNPPSPRGAQIHPYSPQKRGGI